MRITFLIVFCSPEVNSCLILSFAVFYVLIVNNLHSIEISSKVLWMLYKSYCLCFHLRDFPRCPGYISMTTLWHMQSPCVFIWLSNWKSHVLCCFVITYGLFSNFSFETICNLLQKTPQTWVLRCGEIKTSSDLEASFLLTSFHIAVRCYVCYLKEKIPSYKHYKLQ